jgi:hypothetical protein
MSSAGVLTRSRTSATACGFGQHRADRLDPLGQQDARAFGRARSGSDQSGTARDPAEQRRSGFRPLRGDRCPPGRLRPAWPGTSLTGCSVRQRPPPRTSHRHRAGSHELASHRPRTSARPAPRAAARTGRMKSSSPALSTRWMAMAAGPCRAGSMRSCRSWRIALTPGAIAIAGAPFFAMHSLYGATMTQYQVVTDNETVLRDGTIKLHGPAAFEGHAPRRAAGRRNPRRAGAAGGPAGRDDARSTISCGSDAR